METCIQGHRRGRKCINSILYVPNALVCAKKEGETLLKFFKKDFLNFFNFKNNLEFYYKKIFEN